MANNLSRTTEEIKKKLEVSFVPEAQKPREDCLKNDEKSSVSINTAIHTSVNTEIRKRTRGSLKSKATFCLDAVATEQLMAVYIKRLEGKHKVDRSSLICEAIMLLFEKEMER